MGLPLNLKPNAVQVPAPQERPIDLFKAIFEADEDEDEDAEEEEEELDVGPSLPTSRSAAENLPPVLGWSAAGGPSEPLERPATPFLHASCVPISVHS